MPYLNLELHYFEHPKTKRLIGLLGRGAEVLPIKLWSYCGRLHAEDGRLTGYAAEEIEALVEWWGKAGVAVDAMLRVGFLHKDDAGFFVHQWDEHEGHIVAFKQRAKAGAAARWKSHALSNASSNAKARVKQCPILTKPTKPTKDPPSPPAGGRGGGEYLTAKGVEIPPPLRTPEFLAAWADWEAHLREKRVRTTSKADLGQLARCEAWGAEAATGYIRNAIACNWQGIFPPKGNNGSGGGHETPDQFAARVARATGGEP